MDRYFIPDDYTRLELELRYQSSDAKGRVSLLQELSQRNSLSYEIHFWRVSRLVLLSEYTHLTRRRLR